LVNSFDKRGWWDPYNTKHIYPYSNLIKTTSLTYLPLLVARHIIKEEQVKDLTLMSLIPI
jgi:predicted glycosyl hydrolase (DUF1957 family)